MHSDPTPAVPGTVLSSQSATSHDLAARDASASPPAVRIRGHRQAVQNLGEDWTTSRQFDVAVSGSSVALDLMLPHIPPGDIDIRLDLDHSMLKLLVPDGTCIDTDELRRRGRGRVKDSQDSQADIAGGRRIRLIGAMSSSEIRVARGGIAIVTLLLKGRGREIRRAHDAGRLNTLQSPSR